MRILKLDLNQLESNIHDLREQCKLYTELSASLVLWELSSEEPLLLKLCCPLLQLEIWLHEGSIPLFPRVPLQKLEAQLVQGLDSSLEVSLDIQSQNYSQEASLP